MPTVMTTEAATQMARAILKDRGTDMLTTTTACQAGTNFDNEIIPPRAPRPKLPWAYSYAQFDLLLQAYPEVHPEDFVTFGILQEQPRRGSCREWGEVAGVLSHMIGGRRSLVNELIVIINHIDRLDRDDPMRVTEEQALVTVLLRERRRSALPLGDRAFALLAAPGLDRPASPQPGPSGTRGGRPRPAGQQPPGPSGAQGGPRRPPPGFVDLTADEEKMDDAPASPSPNVSDDNMETDEEADLLASPRQQQQQQQRRRRI